MAKIVLIVTLVALVKISSALDCYSCNPQPCKKAVQEKDIRACGTSVPAGACFTHTYINTTTKMRETEKMCVPDIVTEEQYKKYCNMTKGAPIECKFCYTDLCNFGNKLTFGVVPVFIIIAVAYFL